MPSEEEVVEAAGALAADEADRLVFLSDLWLDKPNTLDRLRVVLAGEQLLLADLPSLYMCRSCLPVTSRYFFQEACLSVRPLA